MSRPNVPAGLSTFPLEAILEVTPGAMAYRGSAMAVTIAGENVIVLARSLSSLNIVFNKLEPGETLMANKCPDIVIVQRAEATLDDEL